MNKRDKQKVIDASGLCLTDYLTMELLEGSEGELDKFILDNAWEPYENYSADWVYKRILEVAGVGVGI